MSKIHELSLGSADDMHCRVSNLGAMLMSCSFGGRQVIYPLEEIAEGKKRGGIPICFPFFGPPSILFESCVSQHGWLRNQIFSMHSRFNNVVAYTGSNAPVEPFPWLLVYNVAHVVEQYYLETILQTMRIQDDVSGQAPFNPGFHPYFPRTKNAKVYIGSDVITEFSDKAQCVILKKDDSIIIDTGEIKIRMILTGFDFDTCLYIWSDSDKYFCIEPVLMPAERFGASEGLFLNIGDLLELHMRLAIT